MTHKELLEKLLKDPKFRKEYEKLDWESEFDETFPKAKGKEWEHEVGKASYSWNSGWKLHSVRQKLKNFIQKAVEENSQKEARIIGESILQAKEGWIEQGRIEEREKVRKMIGGLKIVEKEDYIKRYPKTWLDCCGQGEVTGYNQALSDVSTSLNRNNKE